MILGAAASTQPFVLSFSPRKERCVGFLPQLPRFPAPPPQGPFPHPSMETAAQAVGEEQKRRVGSAELLTF